MTPVVAIADEIRLIQLGLSDKKFRVTLVFLSIGDYCSYTHNITRDLMLTDERPPRDNFEQSQPIELSPLAAGDIQSLKREALTLGTKAARQLGSDFVVFVPDWQWYLVLTGDRIEPLEQKPQ